MAYCIHCGYEIPEKGSFCANCGKATNNTNSTTENKRDTVYEGQLHKCPNCSEILNSFMAHCPTCGYEFRNVYATNAVKEFSLKLEAIEAKREKEKHIPIRKLVSKQILSKTDEQKISLIRNFAIPNTKEDLYEFLILSKSNIEIDVYTDSSDSQFITSTRKAVSDAWKAKYDQAYEKAKIVLADDPRINEIQTSYNKTQKAIKKAKWKTWRILGIFFGIFFILITFCCIMASVSEKTEINRLKELEKKLETAFSDNDYKLALVYATNLDFNGNDTVLDGEWEVKQNYWIDKIIETAADNGIILERPTEKEDETIKEESTGDFIDSFNEGLHSNDEEIQSNIEEFNSIMADAKEQWDSAWSDDTTNNITTNHPAVDIENSTKPSQFNIPDNFFLGYEKAEFDKFNSPAKENGLGESRIYFYCTLNKTEILVTDASTAILGYVTDDYNNEWLIHLHFLPAVSETYFDSYMGKSLVLKGVYTGFSGVKNLPCVTLDEMIVLETGEKVSGMQKLLDN